MRRASVDRFQGTRFLGALTIVSRLQLLAKRRHVPLAALALAWVLRQPALVAAIAGAKRREQVQEHLRAVELIDGTSAPFSTLEPIAFLS